MRLHFELYQNVKNNISKFVFVETMPMKNFKALNISMKKEVTFQKSDFQFHFMNLESNIELNPKLAGEWKY